MIKLNLPGSAAKQKIFKLALSGLILAVLFGFGLISYRNTALKEFKILEKLKELPEETRLRLSGSTDPLADLERYDGAGDGHRIERSIEGGTYLLLEDDSLWTVDLMDRIDVGTWPQETDISVIECGSFMLRNEYRFIRDSDGEAINVRYIGRL